MHESGHLRLVEENLSYSAEGLRKTFRKYFRTDAEAQAYARKPERIGSRVYGGRMGNGPESTGDGYRYRGRGLIQITGRANYAASGAELGLDLINKPERLEQPYLAAMSAAEWWHRHGCNILADTGDMAAVTRRVNGGLTGLDDRIKLYSAALRYLGSA